MSNIQRMYAVPSSPFSFTPEEVAQAREDLAHAEREAVKATSWGHRSSPTRCRSSRSNKT